MTKDGVESITIIEAKNNDEIDKIEIFIIVILQFAKMLKWIEFKK